MREGFLTTNVVGPHGLGKYQYWSHSVRERSPFWFNDELVEGGSALELKDGYLLGVEGDIDGWRVCPGDLMQQVACMTSAKVLDLANMCTAGLAGQQHGLCKAVCAGCYKGAVLSGLVDAQDRARKRAAFRRIIPTTANDLSIRVLPLSLSRY